MPVARKSSVKARSGCIRIGSVAAPGERDPVSVLFDPDWIAAYITRARRARGQWAGTRIADPSPRQRAALLAAYGIDPDARDRPSAVGGRRGGLNARTRWARGFVRALYYANDTRHGGPGLALEVEVGVHKPPLGVIPAGQAVRVRVRRGGSVALRAVGRKPDSARIFDDAGAPAGRFSDPALRDW
jgi:hypothetical protein